ncbi:thioesterase family protein [Dactylosporangium sp. CS-047395]|uniref:thioesterase family protein n=1 Tax=Dactylosporangium sp. CS-047395 TaxID=3239936 RepID=UPI003D938A19
MHVVDMWEAPIGEPLELAVTAGLPPVPLPEHCHVEQLIWHGDPLTGPLRVCVAARGANVLTLRIASPDRIVADVRVRRGPARTPRPHALLRTDLRPGVQYTRLFAVTKDVTTDHVPDAEPVLSTPSLIAFMEDTAADILRAVFAPGTASLGTWIGIRHSGPASAGQSVTVTAVLADVRGRRYLFDVRATVDGREIGDGQVAQTLISQNP